MGESIEMRGENSNMTISKPLLISNQAS